MLYTTAHQPTAEVTRRLHLARQELDAASKRGETRPLRPTESRPSNDANRCKDSAVEAMGDAKLKN